MHIPAELIARARALDRDAQCQVAELLLRSRRSDRYKAARPWLLSAASAGSFWAQYMVGLSFDHGRGVRRSVSRAIYWYRLSSAQGYASAHLNLGILLANLPGSRRDLSSAIRLYRLAARAGRPNAAYNLGLYYLRGRGLRQSNRWHCTGSSAPPLLAPAPQERTSVIFKGGPNPGMQRTRYARR